MNYKTASSRDLRLDFFRGIALITIFVNHVPGTLFENFTSRNFGFSDAAEAFVLMSGIAAAFAYTGRVQKDFRSSILKGAGRAFKLYWVHLLITLMTISMTIWMSHLLGLPEFLTRNNMPAILSSPVQGIVGILSLGHQLGYLNILPLYAVLMLAAPFVIWAAIRYPITLLSVSAALWMVAGYLKLNLPNYPIQGGWFLNPLAWQFLFIIGVMIGVSVKLKRKFVPFNPLFFGAAALYLVGACIVVRWQLWHLAVFPQLPDVFGAFDKSYLTLPRLLHILSLAYVVINISIFIPMASHRLAAPFRYLGQNSLVVFSTGTVVSILFQILKARFELSVLEDALLLSAGMAIQFVMPSILAWRPLLSKDLGIASTA